MKQLGIYITFLICFTFISPSQAQSAASLLASMDELMSAPLDKQAVIKMTLKDKSGNEKVREAVMKQKGRYKKLYRYTKPEKQVGIATLSLPDDVLWLYMPAFNKSIKITLLSKSQAFTGTDFSYEDMSGRSYSDRYTPGIISGSDENTYRLELMPKTMNSKYSKIIVTIEKTYFYPLKMEFFDKNKSLFKYATYQYKKQGKYWYAEKVVMTDLKKKHSTEIILAELQFDQGINDDEFLVENLKSDK